MHICLPTHITHTHTITLVQEMATMINYPKETKGWCMCISHWLVKDWLNWNTQHFIDYCAKENTYQQGDFFRQQRHPAEPWKAQHEQTEPRTSVSTCIKPQTHKWMLPWQQYTGDRTLKEGWKVCVCAWGPPVWGKYLHHKVAPHK